MKIFYVIADGLGDDKIKELGNRTPLEFAIKPNLDYFSIHSKYFFPKVIDNLAPESDVGVLANLSYDPRLYDPGRGYFEAIGEDMNVEEGDLALRFNLGIVKGNTVESVRTQLTDDELKEIVDTIKKELTFPIDFDIKEGKVYRGAIVFKKSKTPFSMYVSNNEPGYKFKFFKNAKVGYAFKDNKKIRKIKALRKDAIYTAKILNEFIDKVNSILRKHAFKPNYLFVRDASIGPIDHPSFEEKFGLKALAIVGMPLEIGISKYLGMKVAKIEEIEDFERVEEDLSIKANALKRNYNKYDFIYIHIKQTDAASHLGLFVEKSNIISKVDEYIFGTLKEIVKDDDIVVFSCDHATSSLKKIHTSSNIPVMVSSSSFPKNELKFGEKSTKLKHEKLKEIKDLIPLLLKHDE
ncbi:MAG: hypothetical protein QW061_02480 [Candidatus Rehaiarchaeum fermentans]|nr:hypothetical protein [Candidatus Rehaiarchaeum fermentans]